MTADAMATALDGLAEDVVADWRWVAEDLSASVLGMLLYGLALEIGRTTATAPRAIDAAVERCMVEHVGASTTWSAGLVEAAKRAADDADFHPGHHELIAIGRTFHGVARSALVDNVYANFASVRQAAGLPEPTVVVFVTPLVWLLAAAERQKGRPLEEAEVLAIRDGAQAATMPLSQAERFHATMDARMPVPRLHAERVWEQWQAIRGHIAL